MLKFYSEDERRWDAWKRNHCTSGYSGPFVQFETGETICNSAHFRPDVRTLYTKQGVRVADHTDKAFPAVMTPDGQRVRMTWLGERQRTFVIDDCTKYVIEIAPFQQYSTTNTRNKFIDPAKQTHWCAKHNVPLWLWGDCSVYWPGPGCKPVGPDIKLTRPRKVTTDEREFLAGFCAAMKAQLSMLGLAEYPQPPEMCSWEREYKPQYNRAVRLEDLVKIGWVNADPITKARVQDKGVIMPTEDFFVPHLLAFTPVEERGDIDPEVLT